MSYAITATLLVRLDAHMGEWIAVHDLSEHCGIAEKTVLEHLEPMVTNGMLIAHRHAGTGRIEQAAVNPATMSKGSRR